MNTWISCKSDGYTHSTAHTLIYVENVCVCVWPCRHLMQSAQFVAVAHFQLCIRKRARSTVRNDNFDFFRFSLSFFFFSSFVLSHWLFHQLQKIKITPGIEVLFIYQLWSIDMWIYTLPLLLLILVWIFILMKCNLCAIYTCQIYVKTPCSYSTKTIPTTMMMMMMRLYFHTNFSKWCQ